MNLKSLLCFSRGAMALFAGIGGAWMLAFSATAAPVSVVVTNYRGWEDSLVMNNGKAQVVIVPVIGRVMQFGFAGEESVFWENSALYGNPPEWSGRSWLNFGGDKSWPSPEADWGKFTKRKIWCPPPAFDGMAAEAKVDAETGDVRLISPVDPFYNIRVLRRVHLDSEKPVLTITTTYVRLSGPPARLGVWVITQVNDAEGVFAPLPEKSIFPNRYHLISKAAVPDLKIEGNLLSLTRDTNAAHKIGIDTGTLIWVGKSHALKVESPRVDNAEYPDRGSSAEIYTNPDPNTYIELETLGPLENMGAGSRIERVNVYTLYQRTEATPVEEARKILGENAKIQ